MKILRKFFTSHGIRSHYSVIGSGSKNIVFLHGWGGSVKSFEKLAHILTRKEKYKIYLLDFPGFGMSDDPPLHGWMVKDYTDWFEGALKNIKIKKFYLYVHSFGGRVAVDFLSRQGSDSHQCQKIIFTGSAGVVLKPSLRIRITKIFAKILKKFSFLPFYQVIKKNILQKIFRVHDWALVSEALKNTLSKVVETPDITPKLKKITIPTLLIWGEEDKITPLIMAYKYKDNIFESRLVILPKGKHGIHHTHAKKIASQVIHFINN